jgi:hypothetical protein
MAVALATAAGPAYSTAVGPVTLTGPLALAEELPYWIAVAAVTPPVLAAAVATMAAPLPATSEAPIAMAVAVFRMRIMIGLPLCPQAR